MDTINNTVTNQPGQGDVKSPMTELETIKLAREFIDKLANGVNPVDGSAVPEGDVTGNIRVSRCLFYVSTILGRIVEQRGFINRAVSRYKTPFTISKEQLAGFRYERFPLKYTEIIGRIHELLPNGEEVTHLKYQALTKLLLDHKLVEMVVDASGEQEKAPTSAGLELGIECREFQSMRGPGQYKTIVLGTKAQHFIIDHIDELIANNKLRYSHVVQQMPYGMAKTDTVTSMG